VAIAAGLGLVLLFSELRLTALVGWIAVSPLAFPFLRWPSVDAVLTFDRVWIGALAGIILFRRRGRPATGTSRLLLAALAWLVVCFGVRAALSPSFLSALQTWVDGILLPVVIYAAARETIETPRDARRLGGALAAGGLILAAIGLAEKIRGFELASLSGGTERVDHTIGLVRISGPYGFPEPYALALLVCLAGTLYWMQARRGAAWWIGSAIAVAQMAALSLTFFRVAWIGAVVIAAAAFGLRPKRALRAAAVCALVAVTVLVGSMAFGDNATVETRVQDTANIYARLATYVGGTAIFRDHPVIGVGVGEFTNAQLDYGGVEVRGIDALEYAHSSYVNVLVEQGLVGFIPLLVASVAAWLLIRRFRSAARKRGDVLLAAAATGAGFAYLLMSVTLTMLPFGPSNALFAALLGAVASRHDGLADEHPSEDLS
jgi:hypothetical protein